MSFHRPAISEQGARLLHQLRRARVAADPSSAASTSRLSGPSSRARALAGERRERRQEVDLADQRVGDARLHAAGPAHDHRHARAAVERAVLAAAQRAGRAVSAQLLHRLVPVAVVHDRPVVAREDDERVCRRASADRASPGSRRPHQSSCRITSPRGPEAALAGEAGVRHARHVDVVRGEVEEERPRRGAAR